MTREQFNFWMNILNGALGGIVALIVWNLSRAAWGDLGGAILGFIAAGCVGILSAILKFCIEEYFVKGED